ncbi:MAG: Sapep family Mn(2+)-dependent dipeptidase [Oscillospiraceae bacterium]|nr:Sapep family Mn(2+)-dependent dipeptidase [Oscillospiraceae bacterium]
MDKKAILAQVNAFLAENKENIIQDIADVVAVRSVSEKNTNCPPFGEGCREVLDIFLNKANAMGLSTKDYDGYCGTVEIGSGEKEIGIFAHLDVVPEGNGWLRDPFKATIEDGYIFGRGVMDDKGPAVAGLYTLKCLHDLGFNLKNRVRLFAGLSEETGMECIDYYLTKEKASDFAFTPDADFPVCIGEKGILGILLESEKTSGNIVDFYGGAVSNMVADRATVVLKKGVAVPALDDRFDVEETADGTKITAKGVSSHAAYPAKGINAIHMLAKMLIENGLVSDSEKTALNDIVSILNDCNGAGLGIAFEDEPSGKLTHIVGKASYKDGVITLDSNIRYPVTLDSELLKTSLYKKVEEYSFTVTKYEDSKPTYIPADSPIVTALMDVYKEVTGDKDAKPYTMGGGTYARHLPNAVAFGPEMPNAVLPGAPERGGVHMPDEVASIQQILDSIRIYVLAVLFVDELL